MKRFDVRMVYYFYFPLNTNSVPWQWQKTLTGLQSRCVFTWTVVGWPRDNCRVASGPGSANPVPRYLAATSPSTLASGPTSLNFHLWRGQFPRDSHINSALLILLGSIELYCVLSSL